MLTHVDAVDRKFSSGRSHTIQKKKKKTMRIQVDIQLKPMAHRQFWKLLRKKKYQHVRKCAAFSATSFG